MPALTKTTPIAEPDPDICVAAPAPPQIPVDPAIVAAARAQLDKAASELDAYVERYNANIGASDLARLISSRTELAAAYGAHIYSARALGGGQPF